MAKFPTRAEAERIWQEGILYRLSRPYSFPQEKEYCFHTKGVAAAAEKIAGNITGMNGEKAYVLGLLHDYGKRINEKLENKFHGREGYEQMMLMGYPEVAQICLTHTFPSKDFKNGQYSYPDEWLDWARGLLKNVVYTDYDYLIAFCDKLFEGMKMVTVEKRVEGISARYNLKAEQREFLYNESMELKNYFDKKTGQDVYRLLNLTDK